MAQNSIADTNKKYDVLELKSLLQKKFGERLKILNYSVDRLVTFGENFSGDLLKIRAEVQQSEDSPVENYDFVAKTILSDGIYMNWTTLLSKEAFMYTDIIPLYKMVESENNIEKNISISKFFPNFYGYRLSLDPKKDQADEDAVILLENLKVCGYYVLDKRIGLDLQHATEAMKFLGKFHAFGIATKIKYPVEFEKCKDYANISGYDNDVTMYDVVIDNWIKSIKKVPSFDKYIARVEKIAEERKKIGFKQDFMRHDSWVTIVHNDFWTNNIMFHKDESGKIDGVKVLDFQAYTFADIFMDLYYFLCTSLNNDVKFNHYDDLLDIYYESFISTLKSVQVDVSSYSKQKFDDRLKEVAWFELYHCAFALSFFMCEPDNLDMRDFIEKIMTFQGGELLQKKTADLFKIYDERGWLDWIVK